MHEQGSIKVLLPVRTQLPALRPTVICFELPIRELNPLREALARGPVTVNAFDRDGRQLLGYGTLIIIENAIDRGNVRLRAIFSH